MSSVLARRRCGGTLDLVSKSVEKDRCRNGLYEGSGRRAKVLEVATSGILPLGLFTL